MDQLANNPQAMAMAQAFQSDPEMMALMQDPEIMSKLQQLQSNPASAMQMMSDPQMAPILMKMQQLMSGGGGGGGMGGGMGGFGGGGGAPAASPTAVNSKHVQNLTGGKTQFDQLMQQAQQKKQLLAVDYYTTWCGPCKMISPVFNELADQYHDKIIFLKVDGDAQLELTKAMEIRSYPTFHFYFGGKRVEEFSGARTDELRRIIEDYANRAAVCPFTHFPLRDNELVTYPKIKFDVVTAKIKEQNATLNGESYQLNPTDVGQIDAIVKKLDDKSKWHVSELSENQYSVLNKLINWPIELISMPLHMMRATLLHPHATTHFTKQHDDNKKSDKLNDVNADLVARVCDVCSKTDKQTTALVAVWTLCNMFSRRNLQLRVSERYESVLDAVNTVVGKFGVTDDTLTTACIGLYINYAILFREDPAFYETGKVQLLSIVIEMLESCKTNAKFVYRLLVIVGTLTYGDKNCIDLAKDLEVVRIAGELSQQHKDNKDVVAVAQEVTDCINEKEFD